MSSLTAFLKDYLQWNYSVPEIVKRHTEWVSEDRHMILTRWNARARNFGFVIENAATFDMRDFINSLNYSFFRAEASKPQTNKPRHSPAGQISGVWKTKAKRSKGVVVLQKGFWSASPKRVVRGRLTWSL